MSITSLALPSSSTQTSNYDLVPMGNPGMFAGVMGIGGSFAYMWVNY
jgi:hypothetical protein